MSDFPAKNAMDWLPYWSAKEHELLMLIQIVHLRVVQQCIPSSARLAAVPTKSMREIPRADVP